MIIFPVGYPPEREKEAFLSASKLLCWCLLACAIAGSCWFAVIVWSVASHEIGLHYAFEVWEKVEGLWLVALGIVILRFPRGHRHSAMLNGVILFLIVEWSSDAAREFTLGSVSQACWDAVVAGVFIMLAVLSVLVGEKHALRGEYSSGTASVPDHDLRKEDRSQDSGQNR